MRNSRFIFLSGLFLIFLQTPLFCQDVTPQYEIINYDIAVEVQPAMNFLESEANITVQGLKDNINSIRVFLHKDFELKRVSSGELSLCFEKKPAGEDQMMYSPSGIPIDIDLLQPLNKGMTRVIGLNYSGKIDSIVNGVNMISEHLTEMALYCSWFPLMKGSREFLYNLKITLPKEQICVTDGDLIEKLDHDVRTTWHFQRNRSGLDIPVIASDQFKKKEVETPGITASIYYQQIDDGIVVDYLQEAIVTANFYSRILGEPSNKGKMIFVNSPRDGWGYSRVPLFVVSENYARNLLNSKEGRVRKFHGNAHEIAHFWWSLTDASTSNNWIDEALAEFFALLALEHFHGRSRVNEILAKYQMDVTAIKDSKPILQTLRNDNNAYVLFYEKGAMIFEMLRDMLGDDKLLGILKVFYSQNRKQSQATTEDLLAVFKQETDLNLEPFFSQFLRSNTLPDIELEWEDTPDGVKGRIHLENCEIPVFPLDLTFYKIEQRMLKINPGENVFEFELPFRPDLLSVDENFKLLKEKVEVKKKK